LFEKDNVLHCQGRIDEALVDAETKCPIFLPKNDRICVLVVSFLHRLHNHCGRANLLAIVRRKYWIPQGRRTIDWIIFHSDLKCLNCKKFKLKSFQKPEEPNLPKARIQASRPFQKTGVDYFGPLRVKEKENTKVWVALFTCMVTRCLHLELAMDLSA
jgi:hypothetical protein